MGQTEYTNHFRLLTKKRCLLGFGLLVFLTTSYHVFIPFIVDILALPLFCDKSSPCQNQSVSLYSHNLASGCVTTCHFKNDFAIAVIVLSHYNEFKRRESIRNSWGLRQTYRKTDVATFFLVAHERRTFLKDSDLMKESEEHNDIIFADMIDSDLNLTIKVLQGLTWVTRHCSESNFVVKVDSDVFFNPFSLIDYLYLHNLFSDPQVEFLGGSVCSLCRPRRAFFNQWAISVFIYPHPFYPDYTHGPCYVISQNTAQKIVLAYPFVRMIPYEDVFFTGIVAGMYLKTPRTSVDGMMGYSGRMEFNRKQYATKLIYSHKHSAEEVIKMWLGVLDFRKSHNILH